MTEQLSATQLTLYYSPSCPFCQRVLNALPALGLEPDINHGKAGAMTLKNTAANRDYQNELIAGGGKKTVPCLAIHRDGTVTWMYESLDIIAFLQANLAPDHSH